MNRVSWVLFSLAALLFFAPLHAAPTDFPQRLRNVSTAVDAYLAAQPADPTKTRLATTLRRIVWTRLNADALPDAIVVMKSQRSECAITASNARQQCRALVLLQKDNGEFQVVFDFPLLWHPFLIKAKSDEQPRIFVTTSSTAEPAYTRYDFNGTTFASAASGLSRSDVRAQATMELDDRNMPLIETESYAANSPMNANAQFSPASLLIDNINPGLATSQYMNREKSEELLAKLLPPLTGNLAKLVANIGWPMTLDVRLLHCPDWPVVRRFWETEESRNGKISFCVTGISFIGLPEAGQKLKVSKLPVPTESDQIEAVRYRLLQDIGTAYLLRVVPRPISVQNDLRAPDSRALLTAEGAGVGMLLANEFQLQTGEQAARAQALWTTVVNAWFVMYEQDQFSWTEPTPELRSFISDLQYRQVGLECARRVIAKTSKKVLLDIQCPDSLMSDLASVQTYLKLSRAP